MPAGSGLLPWDVVWLSDFLPECRCYRSALVPEVTGKNQLSLKCSVMTVAEKEGKKTGRHRLRSSVKVVEVVSPGHCGSRSTTYVLGYNHITRQMGQKPWDLKLLLAVGITN